MPVPKEFAGKVTEAQWDKLALNELAQDDRAGVLDALRAALSGSETDADVKEALGLVQEAADMFREEFDDKGFDETEVNAGKSAADAALNEMDEE